MKIGPAPPWSVSLHTPAFSYLKEQTNSFSFVDHLPLCRPCRAPAGEQDQLWPVVPLQGTEDYQSPWQSLLCFEEGPWGRGLLLLPWGLRETCWKRPTWRETIPEAGGFSMADGSRMCRAMPGLAGTGWSAPKGEVELWLNLH